MLKRLFSLFRLPSIDAIELDYLHGSHSRLNLEYRQKEIQNGLFRAPEASMARWPNHG